MLYINIKHSPKNICIDLKVTVWHDLTGPACKQSDATNLSRDLNQVRQPALCVVNEILELE